MEFKHIVTLLSAVTFLISICPVFSQVDETVRDYTFGRDVSEAVIRRLEASSIFQEDHSFLKRLAYVETKFGTDNETFREEYYGGIWQVEEDVFRVTQTNHSSLLPLHFAIKNRFGIDWMSLKWSNLVAPMYSGLAAALYFARVPEEIPFKIADQAEYWRKWYRPLGDASKFIEDSEDLRNQTRCRGKMDLCIVLDSSGSIGNQNYIRAKNFIGQMIESFTLDYNRIGMLVYSARPKQIFHITNNLIITEMANKARDAEYLSAGTRTDLGLYEAVKMFQETEIIEGVPRLVFVFTDGNSDTGSNLVGAVRAAQANSLKTVAVGIGKAIDYNELRLIAMDDTKSVFMLTDFEALQDFLFEITSVACETPQTPALNGTVNDTLIKDEKRMYAFELPDEGITVEVTVESGQTKGYWSWTEKIPSAAIHDGTIEGPTYIPSPPTESYWAKLENNIFTESDTTTEAAPLPASVFITIQGIAETNNYTLASTSGKSDKVTDPPPTTPNTPTSPNDGSSAPPTNPTTPRDDDGSTSPTEPTISTDDNGSSTPTDPTTSTDDGGASTIGLAKLASVSVILVYVLSYF